MTEVSRPPDSSAEVSDTLRGLQTQFVAGLPERVEGIHRMWLELLAAGWSQALGKSLHLAVHSLSGTAGTFGLKAISGAARWYETKLDEVLRSGQPPQEAAWAVLRLAHFNLCSVPRELPALNPAEAAPLIAPISAPVSAPVSTPPFNGADGLRSDVWRVLLVDDDQLVLALHAEVLRQAGMEVLALSQPAQTVEAVKRFEPDVVLLDVHMPEISGPEIAASLRNMEDWLHLAILFLSGETDLTQQLRALDLGGDDFLIKPVQPEHLVAAVNARARRSRHALNVQRRLQTTLYEREREHLALGHHAIVSIADVKGYLTHVSDSFCERIGYRREELLGQHVSFFGTGHHSPSYVAHRLQEVAAGRVWQGEDTARCKDGEVMWVTSTVTPFMDAAGRPYQFVSLHTDISHLKAVQATLKRQRDLQSVIGEAAASMVAAEPDELMPTIREALHISAEQLKAERAYLMLFDRGGTQMNRVVGWDAPGYEPLTSELLAEDFPGQGNIYDGSEPHPSWLIRQMLNLQTLLIPDAKLTEPEMASDAAYLRGIEVMALVGVPLTVEGQLAGLLVYGSAYARPEWTTQEVDAIKVLSEVIGSALARRRAERALRKSESRLNFLVSASPVTIYTCSINPPHALTYVSPNLARLTGFAAEEVLQQPRFWLGHIHPEDRRRVVEQLPKLWVDDVQQVEYRLRTEDGRYLWVHDQLRLVRDSSGQPQEIIGYWMDITERKRYEEKLSLFNVELEHQVKLQTRSVIESERMARATLDALSARVVILDHDGVVLAVNRAWAEFRQDQAGNECVLEGQNYLDLCDRLCDTATTAGKPIAAGIRRLMAGEVDEFFHEYMVEGGVDPRWFVCRVDRFPGQGDVRVVVSHEDITLLKMNERQQMRSQRLESLGTLAGGVAHDLNNALAPILMGIEVLKEDYPNEASVLNMIHASARRGADRVRQLLAFAKGADGERVALDVARLVQEVESLMRGSFPKSIQRVVSYAPSLPGVLGDSTQLHQVDRR